jgi:hypothetical protein
MKYVSDSLWRIPAAMSMQLLSFVAIFLKNEMLELESAARSDLRHYSTVHISYHSFRSSIVLCNS